MTPQNSWWSWDHAFAVLPELLFEGFSQEQAEYGVSTTGL